MGAFEDFVNTELPRRSPLLTFANTSYDGDPNDGGAPAIVSGAPLGTWYHRKTGDTFWRKNEAGTYVESGTGGGSGVDVDILYTLGAMSATVDYEDAGAVDPPAGLLFRDQTEMDDWLATQGATKFKHMQKLWDALPAFLLHPITIEVASGVHRPDPSVSGYIFMWNLSGKQISKDGSVTINGAPASEWDDVVASQPITAVQVGSYDPWVQVSGTPFPTDGSLKGLLVVLSTGQISTIHDHTADKLFITSVISPTGPTSVRVCRPSTIVRNSRDDVVRASNYGCINTEVPSSSIYTGVTLNRLMTETFDSNAWDFMSNGTTLRWNNVLVDHKHMKDSFGFPGSRTLQMSGWGLFIAVGCGFRGALDVADDEVVAIFGTVGQAVFTSFRQSVFYGHRKGVYMDKGCRCTLYDTVFDQVGRNSLASVLVYSDAEFHNQHVFGGKRSTFRSAAGRPGILFDAGHSLAFTTAFWFENFTTPCVKIVKDCKVDFSENGVGPNYGFFDGGGNTDVGIEVSGAHNLLWLSKGTNVTGTVGDLRIEGVVGSYADLPTSAATLITGKLNRLSKEV